MSLKKIGPIGGMNSEGSAVYFCKINEAMNQHFGGLNSAEKILLESVTYQQIVAMRKSNC